MRVWGDTSLFTSTLFFPWAKTVGKRIGIASSATKTRFWLQASLRKELFKDLSDLFHKFVFHLVISLWNFGRDFNLGTAIHVAMCATERRAQREIVGWSCRFPADVHIQAWFAISFLFYFLRSRFCVFTREHVPHSEFNILIIKQRMQKMPLRVPLQPTCHIFPGKRESQ